MRKKRSSYWVCCGCELQPLRRLEAQAERLERLAVQCLSWDLDIAEQAVAKALRLQRRPLALALRGFIGRLGRRPILPP